MRTIQDQFSATNNHPSGFDYLRLVLSISVIAWHTILVCYGRDAETPIWTGPLRPVIYIIIPSFFALSGFLVAGSLERNDLSSFLTLRGLRIFPALAIEVVISALVLGPILTTESLDNYFSSPLLLKYFENIFGIIHYILPGVFSDVPAGPKVNVQLWTVPYELECYIAVSFISVIGLYMRPRLFLSTLIVASLAIFGHELATEHFVNYDSPPPGRMIVFSFLFGVGIFAFRTRIPWSGVAFAISLSLSWIFLSLRETAYLAPLPVAYVTIFLGLQNPRRIWLLRGGDYSYGLYLYGYPVQQTISYLFPGYRLWFINFAGSLIASGILALLSWHFVETKIMGQKRQVLALVKTASRRVAQLWIRPDDRRRTAE